MTGERGEIWLVRAVSPKSLEFGVIAINFGHVTEDRANDMRVRVGAVLADATATLERLGVAHAISEARMRAQTDQLREALIGSVSTSCAHRSRRSGRCDGAGRSAGFGREKKSPPSFTTYMTRAEAQQRYPEFARCDPHQQRGHQAAQRVGGLPPTSSTRRGALPQPLGNRRLALDIPPDLPLIHIDPVLVQQALVQIFDNAVKYSKRTRGSSRGTHAGGQLHESVSADQGAGLTSRSRRKSGIVSAAAGVTSPPPKARVLASGSRQRFHRRQRRQVSAASKGPGHGTAISIDLPVSHCRRAVTGK